jgi:hypothetical protein
VFFEVLTPAPPLADAGCVGARGTMKPDRQELMTLESLIPLVGLQRHAQSDEKRGLQVGDLFVHGWNGIRCVRHRMPPG